MTPRQAKLLRLLQRHPEGLGLTDIITFTGGTHHSCGIDLRALEGEGLAGRSTITGLAILWAAASDLAALNAKRRAERAAAAVASGKEGRRSPTEQERAMDAAACEAFARRPVRSHLSQEDWTGRAPTRGVPSVFHMGGAAP